MPLNTSRLAYEDCYELLNRAMAAPNGIRAACGVGDDGIGVAYYLRTRLHYARTLARRESMQIYEETDPEYGISPYDHLVIKIKDGDGQWWVYIEPRRISPKRIEDLEEAAE